MTTDNHQKSYVCIHVFADTRPVLLVSRAEGDWCFLCGAEHAEDASAYCVVGIGHVFEKDPTLKSLHDLEPDWEAEREDVGKPWIRTRCEYDS